MTYFVLGNVLDCDKLLDLDLKEGWAIWESFLKD